jgi:hypothetical protein
MFSEKKDGSATLENAASGANSVVVANNVVVRNRENLEKRLMRVYLPKRLFGEISG